MHINNPDALRNWLSVVLEPLCDADPAALARYVLALLKKDKPLNDLKTSMQEQLDVFLGPETLVFVDRLFAALDSEEYFTATEDASQKEKDTKKVVVQENVVRECTPPIESNKAKDIDSLSLSPAISLTMSASSGVVSPPQVVENKVVPRTEEAREMNIKRKRRSKSRSRSLERIKRSRSRDRRGEHNREKTINRYRNKSPPPVLSMRRRPHLDVRRHRSQSGSRSRSVSPDKKPSRSISPNIGFGADEQRKKSQRCRDFDEKGYCMRGETCPWDHGVDPVVLEDLNSPALLTLPGPPRPLMPEYNPYAPELWNRGPRQGPAFGRLPPAAFKNTNSGTFAFPNQVPRELIPVPVVGDRNNADGVQAHMQKRRFDEDPAAEGPIKRKPPMASRLGTRITNQGQQNCSLELRKIPRGLNAIAHLNNHFSKFGKITNIQISYDGDPEAAIITFSTHAEANVAYRSTEAVLNNRFIKVFWHTSNSTSDSSGQNKSEGMRKNQYVVNHKSNETTNTTNSSSEANTNASAIVSTLPSVGKSLSLVNNASSTAAVSIAPRMNNPKLKREVAQLARKQKENAVQVACGLTKKKQTLLEGYIKQMSSMVELLSKSDLTEVQKNTYKDTIKELEKKINELRREISSEQQRLAQVQPQIRKTKEQKQKELLDVELDLITQEHDGNDAVAIQKKLKEIQKSINAVAPKGRPRTVVPRGSTTIDRRTTAIHVAGFDLEDSDTLLGHFKHFGEITKNYLDRNVPYLIISYATRLNAEQAMQRGATFKEKTLRMMWITPKEEPVSKAESSTAEPEKAAATATVEDEEDDQEERSWRR